MSNDEIIVDLESTRKRVKGDSVFNVSVNGKVVGTLRRTRKADGASAWHNWIYNSIVSVEVHCFASFGQAARSLIKFPPRIGKETGDYAEVI